MLEDILIKLIGKILLLPVVLLLAILWLLVKIGMEISTFILGALMLIVFGRIIFSTAWILTHDSGMNHYKGKLV